jgi:hypothetical protein
MHTIMRYFNKSTECNDTQPSSINTVDIDLQHLRSRRRHTFPYNNKTKDQSYPRVYSISIKQDESNSLTSNQFLYINNTVSIPTNTSDSMILSSKEK